jgi:hypothetical protein
MYQRQDEQMFPKLLTSLEHDRKHNVEHTEIASDPVQVNGYPAVTIDNNAASGKVSLIRQLVSVTVVEQIEKYQ